MAARCSSKGMLGESAAVPACTPTLELQDQEQQGTSDEAQQLRLQLDSPWRQCCYGEQAEPECQYCQMPLKQAPLLPRDVVMVSLWWAVQIIEFCLHAAGVGADQG